MARPASGLSFRRLPDLLRWPLDRPLFLVSVLLFLVSFVFLMMPQLDLVASAIFYDPRAGFEEAAALFYVRRLGRLAEWTLAAAFAAPLVFKLFAPESRLFVRPRTSLFALASLALGPGLIVNGALKAFWGRARPREIIEFGGDAGFSPVWWISDQCDRNCSFVSGEAASAFWLVSLAFVAPKAWRPAVAIVTLAVATAVSFTRLAAGGHFVSDVLIAWLVTLLVMIVLQRIVLRGLPPAFDHRVEAALARSGRALRAWLSPLR
ncbi:MAG: phosphatase PAP2 family protein [Propylenella sp.]